jgi:hypothetical protein
VLPLQKIIEAVDKINQKETLFELSIFTKIKSNFCEIQMDKYQSFNMKIYEKAQEIINEKLDILNYLKFCNEYLYLKCILLSDIQTLCFSYLESPKLYEKNKFNVIHSKDIKKISQIVAYFRKNDLNPTDEKIFNLLSEYIKELIKGT